MSQEIIELAEIMLAEGTSEQELLHASDTFQRDFLNDQEGFIRRDMLRRSDGHYLDIIRWQSLDHAHAVFQKAQQSQAAAHYFSMMQFDPEQMDEGVQHCPLLRSFSRHPA